MRGLLYGAMEARLDTGQTAGVFGRDNIVVQAVNSGVNVTVVHGQPYLRLTRYARRTALDARTGKEVALLSAYRDDIVPLIGRENALDDLRGWLAAEKPVSIRVLTGGAGRGKTRLAIEFARAVESEWLAGFLETADFERFRRDGRTEAWRWEKPALIIVDYAASRVAALRDWLDEINDADLEGRPKLRLLLLERQANPEIGWLADLFGRAGARARTRAALFDPPAPVELAPLGEGRRRLFETLFRRGGGEGDVGPGFDARLAEPKWGGDPLFLMMAGLVAAKAGVAQALSLSRADLAFEVADLELKRIGRLGAARSIDGRALRRLAALATLVQGLDLKQARRLAEGLGGDAATMVLALRDALPRVAGGAEIGPILPDMVGEAAILRVYGDEGEVAEAGGETDAPVLVAAGAAVVAASETLVRAAQDFAADGHLEPIRWLEALADAPETDLGALMQIAEALPDRTLALRETAVKLHRKFYDLLLTVKRAEPDVHIERLEASSLNSLANSLSHLGRREEALVAAQEVVSIYRRLVAERPDGLMNHLAGSLTNVGNRLSDLGRHKEALAAAQAAVEICRRLADERPGAFLPDLARSLSNVGNRLSDLGQREEALEAAQEAVEICRRLADERPDAFLPELASSLNNVGNRLSGLGRSDEALTTAQKAVEIYRRLAVERPDAFLPELASSINNVAGLLSKLGRSEEALPVAQEAVAIRRWLAAVRPDAFLCDLASSIYNVGGLFIDLGRRSEALAAAQEAVEINRNLVGERPDVFLPDLATSLNSLGTTLRGLGRPEEALAATLEALESFRRLAAQHPNAFLPDLALSLNNIANRLSELGRGEEALAAAQDAVEIYCRLAAERPDAFQPDFARSLGTLGKCCEGLGSIQEAHDAIREAIKTLQPAFLLRPRAHAPGMALMCRDYLDRCRKLDAPPDEALLAPVLKALRALPTPSPNKES